MLAYTTLNREIRLIVSLVIGLSELLSSTSSDRTFELFSFLLPDTQNVWNSFIPHNPAKEYPAILGRNLHRNPYSFFFGWSTAILFPWPCFVTLKLCSQVLESADSDCQWIQGKREEVKFSPFVNIEFSCDPFGFDCIRKIYIRSTGEMVSLSFPPETIFFPEGNSF